MTGSLKVTNLTCTCISHPAQWEGRLADGRFVYIRYRYGWLCIGLSPNGKWEAVRASGKAPFYASRVGSEYDGELSYQELRRLMKGRMELPEQALTMSGSDPQD